MRSPLHPQAMKIPSMILAVAEKKKRAQRFLLDNFGNSLGHVFDSNNCFIEGSGRCHLHGKTCNVPIQRAHVATAGLPCQPFSKARTKQGGSARTSSAPDHPDYTTVMVEWAEYLGCRRPMSFWVEEVVEFETCIDHKTGSPCMWLFAKACVVLGYVVKAIKLDHGLWIAGAPRERTSGVSAHARILYSFLH